MKSPVTWQWVTGSEEAVAPRCAAYGTALVFDDGVADGPSLPGPFCYKGLG
jgi:hypothetical protein